MIWANNLTKCKQTAENVNKQVFTAQYGTNYVK